MPNTFRIEILNSKAEDLLKNLEDLGLILIHSKYDSFFILNYDVSNSQPKTYPELNLKFIDFKEHETYGGDKYYECELSEIIPSLEINYQVLEKQIPRTARYESVNRTYRYSGKLKTVDKVKIIENIKNIFVPEIDFNEHMGFWIDRTSNTAVYKAEKLFLDISDNGLVWLVSKSIKEYLTEYHRNTRSQKEKEAKEKFNRLFEKHKVENKSED